MLGILVLLQRLHGDVLDRESVLRLESALKDADKITKIFQARVHGEKLPDSSSRKASRSCCIRRTATCRLS